MRYLIVLHILILSFSLFGQVKPNEFNIKTAPVGTDEIYSQTGGISVRIPFNDAKTYFTPSIKAINYQPTTVGNLANLMTIVQHQDGRIWYIDSDGVSVLLSNGDEAIPELPYDSDEAAAAAGVEVGQTYKLSINNVYGKRENSITKRIY